MSFLNTALAAEDLTLQKRVTACLFKVAGDIINEPPETDEHELRVELANLIRSNLNFRTLHFTWMVASNPTISGMVTVDDATGSVEVPISDGDIEFVCISVWNIVARSTIYTSAS